MFGLIELAPSSATMVLTFPLPIPPGSLSPQVQSPRSCLLCPEVTVSAIPAWAQAD